MKNRFFLKKNNLFTNSFYLYLSQFSDYFLSLFILPLIARKIGAVEFGKIALAQAFGVVMILTMEFGSSLIATREVARLKANNREIKLFISKMVSFKILLIPILIIILCTVIYQIPIFIKQPYYIIFVGLGAIFQGLSPVWYFQGIEKIKHIAASKIIFRSLAFLLILFFVKSPKDSIMVLIFFTVSNFFIFLYLFFVMLRNIGPIKLASFSKSKLILKKSSYSFLISIIPVIFQTISISILSISISPYQLGLYFGASKIYKAYNALYGPISQAFFPVITNVNSKSLINSQFLLKKYLMTLFIFGILMFALNYFFAEKIIFILLGEKYIQAQAILKIFGLVLPLTAITNALGRQWLMVINRDRFYFTSLIVSSFIALLVFICTLDSLGSKAYPVSLVAFEFTSIVLISIFLYKK